MKKIILVIVIITLLFATNAKAIGGGPTDHLNDPTPGYGEEDVDIEAKGVQTCINVTVDTNCTVNLTFQWWNETAGGWSTYGYTENLGTSGQICYWNDNVTCATDNFWSLWFHWRVIANFTCANTTYTEIMYSYFNPEDCPLFYIYPAWNETTVCPCCDAICVGINNVAGHNIDMIIHGHEKGDNYWYIWNQYVNVTNGTYCYCMDTIQSTIGSHAVMRSVTQQNVTVVDTWYNITFDYGHIYGNSFDADPATGAGKILRHGYYTLTYWVCVQDADPNPAGHKMAVRIFQNNSFELEGSYREVVFSRQSADRHLMSQVHKELFAGTTLRFQYIGDDTDQRIKTSGTWSTENVSFYAHLEKTACEEHQPLKYNTTYQWYVNVTDATTGDYNISEIFSFTTAQNISDCFCGNITEADVGGAEKDYIVGIIGLMGLMGLVGWFMRRKE